MVQTDNVQRVADSLRAAGVGFVSPDVVATADGSRQLVVRDPDGHALKFVEEKYISPPIPADVGVQELSRDSDNQ